MAKNGLSAPPVGASGPQELWSILVHRKAVPALKISSSAADWWLLLAEETTLWTDREKKFTKRQQLI